MKEILIDFGIPAMLIGSCVFLMAMGIDSEVKAVFTMAGAWAFHGVVTRRRKGG